MGNSNPYKECPACEEISPNAVKVCVCGHNFSLVGARVKRKSIASVNYVDGFKEQVDKIKREKTRGLK